MIVLFLSVALIFTCNSWGDDIEYQCCCQVECCYNYNIETDPFTVREVCVTPEKKCTEWNVLLEELCEGGFQATLYCIDRAIYVRSQIDSGTIVTDPTGKEKVWLIQYDHHIGSCELVSNA